MSASKRFTSSNISGNLRLALWFLLLILTLLIFLYPINLTLEYHRIQSLYVFSNLHLFGALFSIWTALLLFLLFTRISQDSNPWEKVILVCVYSLGFIGLVVSMHQGYSAEVFGHALDMNFISQEGKIGEGFKWGGYLPDFPGLSLLGSSLCQITGLESFDIVFILLMLLVLLFPAFLFIVFQRMLQNPLLAALGVLISIQGNIMVAKCNHFHPGVLAPFLLFVPATIVLFRGQDRVLGSWQDILIFVILLATATIMHCVTSFCFFLIILGIFLMQRAQGGATPAAICFIVPMTWQMYWAFTTFEGLAHLPSQLYHNLFQAEFISGYGGALASAYSPEATPLWASITRYFWMFFLFGFAAILTIKNIFRINKEIDWRDRRVTGGLVGIGLLGFITIVGSGMEETFRVLIYSVPFAAPIILSFLFKSRIRKFALVGLTLLLLISSFPNFLVNNNTVVISRYYSHELSSGQFIKDISRGKQENYYIFSPSNYPISYYAPNAKYRGYVQVQFAPEQSPEGSWKAVSNGVAMFKRSAKDPNQIKVFAFNGERIRIAFQHLWGVDPKLKPEWQKLKVKLTEESQIYNNGYIQLYQNTR